MTPDSPSLQIESPVTVGRRNWWEKPLIWASFLCLIYVLREFFLIGFLTFLFCFIVRSLVGVLIRRLSPGAKATGTNCF